jgi:hypothetical protein
LFNETWSRSRSRLARAALARLLEPALRSARAQLAPACPWRGERDVFAEQERAKVRVHERHWKCALDNKAFYSEETLDAHFGRRHPTRVLPGADVCLADFCDVLQCDALVASHAAAASFAGAGHAAPPAAPPSKRCSPPALAQAQHRCFELLDVCLPILPGAAAGASLRQSRAHSLVAARHCERLTCEQLPQLFPPGEGAAGPPLLGPAAMETLEALGIFLLACALFAYYGMLARQFGFIGGGSGRRGWAGKVARTGVAGVAATKRGGGAGKGRTAAQRAGQLLLGGKLGVRVAMTRLALILWKKWQARRRRGAVKKRRE